MFLFSVCAGGGEAGLTQHSSAKLEAKETSWFSRKNDGESTGFVVRCFSDAGNAQFNSRICWAAYGADVGERLVVSSLCESRDLV